MLAACDEGPHRSHLVGTTPDTRIGVAAQARLRYRLSKSSLDLRYERFMTSGGGLFAGAQTDMVRFGVEHPLSRVWSLSADLGFRHNDRLQPLTQQQIHCLHYRVPKFPERLSGQ